MAEIYRGAWVVAYRDLLNFVSDRFRMLASLAFPLLFLLIFGAGFANVVGRMAGGVSLIQFMYPGIIAQMVLTTSLFSGVSIVQDREAGFLREILVAPITTPISGLGLGPTGPFMNAGFVLGGLLLIAGVLGVFQTGDMATAGPRRAGPARRCSRSQGWAWWSPGSSPWSRSSRTSSASCWALGPRL